MSADDFKDYKYNGAKSLVNLHENYLLSFFNTWQEAKNINVILPITDDPDYESLETLLLHVLRSSGGYLKWICNNLDLPEPKIKPLPNLLQIEFTAEEYIRHLIKIWLNPLADIPEELFHKLTFKSNWGADYCIEAMIEHAVMHPLRHEFQLKNLILNKE